MKKIFLTILVAVGLGAGVHAAEVNFSRAGVAIDPPENWIFEEAGNKASAINPDKVGKIQAFMANIPKTPIKKAVQAYHEKVFKDGASPRPGKPVEVLESTEFRTKTGLSGVKGAFGYKKGANGSPEVWTWRYFFERPDGKVISICSFVYGDAERARAQETIISDTLRFLP